MTPERREELRSLLNRWYNPVEFEILTELDAAEARLAALQDEAIRAVAMDACRTQLMRMVALDCLRALQNPDGARVIEERYGARL